MTPAGDQAVALNRMRYLFATFKNRLDPRESVDLTLMVRDFVQPRKGRLVGLCPSALAIPWVNGCKGDLALAAQSCGWTAPYALTGELSVKDLDMFSVRYCLVGHSERRSHLGETEEIVRRRLEALLCASIVPILCVGESLDQRRAGRSVEVIAEQLATLSDAFAACTIAPDPARAIVAYEPMWAISTAGSHLTLTADDAATSHAAIRQSLDALFGAPFGAAISILFGGSVNAADAKSFFDRPAIDGALVGTGMQTAAGFADVLRAFYGARPERVDSEAVGRP
jgi:triosephosphate isomerase